MTEFNHILIIQQWANMHILTDEDIATYNIILIWLIEQQTKMLIHSRDKLRKSFTELNIIFKKKN